MRVALNQGGATYAMCTSEGHLSAPIRQLNGKEVLVDRHSAHVHRPKVSIHDQNPHHESFASLW